MMKLKSLYRFILALALPLLPALAGAQTYFTATHAGDVNVGFRKTGVFQEQYEMVVYLGNVSNFLAQAPGTQIAISSYSVVQLSNMCPDGFGNLQWSAFSSFEGPTLTNSAGVWPQSTCWYTVPRTNVNAQTTPIARLPSSTSGSYLELPIYSVTEGATTLSQQLVTSQGNTNINNNFRVILEPINLNPQQNLTTFIGDKQNPVFGDFGGGAITFSVENTTPNNFTSASISDFYVNVPYSSNPFQTLIDPLTGQANGNADYLGYFTLNPNGTMTFTRAAAAGAAPVAGFSGTPVLGFAPLQVTFNNASTGTITNSVWNFGDGQSVTNATSASVNHTYVTGGSYSVTLTVNGPGGSDTKVQSSYIMASSSPQLTTVSVSGGNLVFGGTNCPAGNQYRILSSTNVFLPMANWQPVYTNTFAGDGSFRYTNSTAPGKTAFFRLVSP